MKSLSALAAHNDTVLLQAGINLHLVGLMSPLQKEGKYIEDLCRNVQAVCTYLKRGSL